MQTQLPPDSSPRAPSNYTVESLEARTLLAATPFFIGMISPQYSSATKIAAGADGSVIVTGVFGGQVNFNPRGKAFVLTADGPTDVFIAKYDRNGGLLWADRFGGPEGNFHSSQAIDIDTDPSRAGLWVNSVDTQPQDLGEYVNGVAVDSAGNVYFTGATRGPDTFGGPSATPQTQPQILNIDVKYYDIYLIKLDPNGKLVWADSMGGQFQDVGRSLALDSAGDPYVAGIFSRSANLNPNPKGTPVILTTTGRTGAFVAKYTSDGALVWATATAISDETDAERRSYANAIAVDANGNAYITGNFAGDTTFNPSGTQQLNSLGKTDQFVQKFSNTGVSQWVFDIGGQNYDGGTAIALSPGGTRVYVGGYFEDTVQVGIEPNAPTFTAVSAGGNPDFDDLLVTKLNAQTGTLVFAKQIKSPSWKTIGQMTTDSAGNLYLTGGFYYTANFGPGFSLTSTPSNGNFNDNNDSNRTSAYNIYVVKMNQSGIVQYADQIGAAGDSFGVGLAIDDSDDDLLVAGRYRGTVNFDPTGKTLKRLAGGTGPSNGFAIRLSPNGDLI